MKGAELDAAAARLISGRRLRNGVLRLIARVVLSAGETKKATSIASDGFRGGKRGPSTHSQ